MPHLFSQLTQNCQWKVRDATPQSFEVFATAANDALKAQALAVCKVGCQCVVLANLSPAKQAVSLTCIQISAWSLKTHQPSMIQIHQAVALTNPKGCCIL